MMKMEKLRFALVAAWSVMLVSAAAGQTKLDDPIVDPITIGPLTVGLEQVASGLGFATDLETAGDGSGRLFIAELGDSGDPGGKISIVKDGIVLTTPFLDLSGFAASVSTTDFGLTGFAFHPDFDVEGSIGQGKLYTVSAETADSGAAHFGPTNGNHQSVLYEWMVSQTDSGIVDLASRREILRVNQPRQEHNMNEVVFGPDDNLYISLGDGGNTDSQSPNAQNTESIFGKILRIDVDDTSGNGRYSIPQTNPFAGSANNVEEIFAYGLRNPYRMSFDRETGVLYTGDVGQIDIEEVNRIELGGNYGWNEKEGTFKYLGFGNGVSDDLSTLPTGFNAIDPIGQYDHDEGRSVTGGFVYRGISLPQLVGQYVFGDFRFGRLFHMDLDTGLIQEFSILPSGASLPDQILGFGQDEAGELYLTGIDGNFTGVVMRLVPEPTTMSLVAVGALFLMRPRRAV